MMVIYMYIALGCTCTSLHMQNKPLSHFCFIKKTQAVVPHYFQSLGWEGGSGVGL